MESSDKKTVKPRFWLGFSIGLMVGFIFAIVFYFVDKSLNDSIKLFVTTPNTSDKVEAEKKPEPETSPYIGKKISTEKKPKKAAQKDTAYTTSGDTLLMDADFSLDKVDEATEVYQEKCLTRKHVSVKPWKAGETSTISTFEVEEWSESAMNKISYYRHNNTLKIKGLKIQNIKIWFHGGHFFLENNGRYYAIPENDDFHRLTPTSMPNA